MGQKINRACAVKIGVLACRKSTKANHAMNKRLYNAEEAGNYIGYSAKTLETWRANGEGPKFIRFGRTVRYELADLDAWIEKQKAAANA